MQRFSLGILFLAALYVSASANAIPEQPVAVSAVTAQGVVITTVQAPPPAPALPTTLVADNPAPHIALLLPLKSKSTELANYAKVVQQGFSAAAAVQQGLPVRVYASSEEPKEVVTLYRQAITNGALAVAGPLTRDGVATLAAYPGITVPTLALNTSELPNQTNQLYFFGLPAENEARQIAQIAALSGLHDATVVTTNTAISKRLAAAFADEWAKLGGTITAEVVFKGDSTVITKLPVAPWPEGTEPQPASAVSETGEPLPPGRPLPPPIAPGNMVFLATDHDKARRIRPYLNPGLPVYATSLLFKGNTNQQLANYDLNEIRFVDMPWLLQPDHPAVMIYPRAETALEPEEERLYAMGIDAYRLVHILLTRHAESGLPLDGVTGRISLNRLQFQREGLAAFFRIGLGLTADTLAALNAAKAAAKEAAEQASNVEITPSPAP
jgi:hypothetical protein